MGFTPLEGLMMGTRSGSIDPGIVTHLLRSGSIRPDEVDNILNRQSGLLGISGISGDMREIEQSMRDGNERARLAFNIFIHRLWRSVAAMAVSLRGMDVLVFTAGIGENSAHVRAAACGRLGFLEAACDRNRNDQCEPDEDISAENSRVRTLVIRAQEDWAIARKCAELLP